MASLWGGRFEKDMDEIVKKYNASIFFDQRMYNEKNTMHLFSLTRECTTRTSTAASRM